MKNIVFTALFAALAAGSAHADPRDDALSGMLRCSGIGDKAQRLVCYDSAVVRVPGAMNSISTAPASPPVVTASAVPPPAPAVVPRRKRSSSFMDRLFGAGPKRAPQTTVAQFGNESIANGGAHASPIAMDNDTIDQISARLVSYEFDSGYVTVTLDNGQVWRETPDGNPVQTLARPALAYSAVISRGSAGSYDMKLSGVARIVPVRRVR
jgi:hypothetical protein